MATTGSGQGTPIEVVTPSELVYDQFEEVDGYPNTVVSLSRYAKIIGYDEAAFWGVIYENQHLYGCGPLWNEYERMNVANALAEAEFKIESVIGFPLKPTWVVGKVEEEPNYDFRYVDQQTYRPVMVARYPRILAPGVRTVTTLESNAEVTHSQEISTVGPIATTATDPLEIHVFYPGSNREIKPSKITISSGYVTLEIPRYRMVKAEFLNTPEGGIAYEISGYYLTEVDVKRIYNDPSTQAILVRENCHNNQCVNGCRECTQTACLYVRDEYIGSVVATPAAWDADTSSWSTNVICGRGYHKARLYYQCGMKTLNLQAEKAIVMLAHTLMGRPPCSCDKTAQLWQQAYEVPNILTRERLNNPFGLSNGAWMAWRFALTLRSLRASVLGN